MQYVEIFPHPPAPSPNLGEGEQEIKNNGHPFPILKEGEQSSPRPNGHPSPILKEGEQPSPRPNGHPSPKALGEGTGVRARNAGYAPYLDYRPLKDDEKSVVETILEKSWQHNDLETQAKTYAIKNLVPQHLQEIKQRKEELTIKTMIAVKDRLTKEINYWDYRASELKTQELAGKANAKINSEKARQRADELQARLQQRLSELEQERKLSPLPPVIFGGALIVPIGLLNRLLGKDSVQNMNVENIAISRERIEKLAMAAVIEAERKLGYEPRDVSSEKCGYDIESSTLTPLYQAPLSHFGRGEGGEGLLRFIEVKGRIAGAKTVTVTKNEIIAALNKPDNFILAIVQVPSTESSTDNCQIRYIHKPFQQEPDFAATSVNYNLQELWQRGTEPI
ncbi:MAG: DUF3883 domain-containing protein [Rivularia sp. (in: Bacteria)]|nr:DUF3883 domain-containing protein [Rivularia sp. MS3]